MTHEQMYEAVRGKVIEACPETLKIVEWKGKKNIIIEEHPLVISPIDHGLPIRLSHVLRAIDVKTVERIDVAPTGEISRWQENSSNNNPDNLLERVYWHLPSDDLSKQGPEVIKFLYSILVE